MMMRSAPPSSAHLAESPVPAPAPITALPASIWPRMRASAVSRFMSFAFLMGDGSVESVGHLDGQVILVDRDIATDDDDVIGELGNESVDERLVGCRVEERTSFDVDAREACFGEEHRRRRTVCPRLE